ncbi:hypothetical protein WDW37_13915 [Bdellovibrionota bacterium FG-1]
MMNTTSNPLFSIRLLVLAAFSLITTAAGAATEGFYPLWETTAHIEKHREAYIGTNGAHYGILDVAQVGVQPVNFIYRSPNVYGKISLGQRGQWSFATQLGAYYLMSESSRAYFSPMYSSRLDNPDFSIVLFPVSLSASLEVSDWFDLSQTVTGLNVYSPQGALQNMTYFGYSAVGEFKTHSHHSMLLHASEVGFWNHDFSLLGISYRYHNSWMEFRIGYFYRLRTEGAQTAPLIGLGFVI